MITLDSISKTYYTSANEKTQALQSVSLHLEKGDFVVLLGSNGSGKSTLLNAIAGSVRIDSGSIFILEKNVTSLQEYERSKYISRVFQNPLQGTASDLSIEENFRLASLRTKKKMLQVNIYDTFRNRIKERIEILGLGFENKLEKPMGLLSGGQRQALTLLMATMDETKVLLMDEPVAALDPKSAEVVMAVAQKLSASLNITTILITHRMKDALDYGNKLIFMQEGKIEKQLSKESKSKLTIAEIAEWF